MFACFSLNSFPLLAQVLQVKSRVYLAAICPAKCWTLVWWHNGYNCLHLSRKMVDSSFVAQWL